MNTAPPDDLDGDGGEAARPLGFDGALFVSSAVPDAAALGLAPETAPPSAVFFLGARLRRRLFFSVLAAPPPGGAVAPSPSEAAARFRANVGSTGHLRTGGSRAEGRDGRDDTRGHPRRASRVTRPRAMRDARLRGGGVCHHDRRCCDGAVTLCAVQQSREVAFLPPRSYPALHSRVAHGSAEVLLTLHTSKGRTICC